MIIIIFRVNIISATVFKHDAQTNMSHDINKPCCKLSIKKSGIGFENFFLILKEGNESRTKRLLNNNADDEMTRFSRKVNIFFHWVKTS